jgi:hypothetical protein
MWKLLQISRRVRRRLWPHLAGQPRSKLWRAKMVANIPDEEFEDLIEGPNPSTVTALVEIGRANAQRNANGLRRFIRAWDAASEQDRAAFFDWLAEQG